MLSLGITAAGVVVCIYNVTVSANSLYFAEIRLVPGCEAVIKYNYFIGARIVVIIEIAAKEISVFVLKGVFAAEKSGEILLRKIENSIVGIVS